MPHFPWEKNSNLFLLLSLCRIVVMCIRLCNVYTLEPHTNYQSAEINLTTFSYANTLYFWPPETLLSRCTLLHLESPWPHISCVYVFCLQYKQYENSLRIALFIYFTISLLTWFICLLIFNTYFFIRHSSIFLSTITASTFVLNPCECKLYALKYFGGKNVLFRMQLN